MWFFFDYISQWSLVTLFCFPIFWILYHVTSSCKGAILFPCFFQRKETTFLYFTNRLLTGSVQLRMNLVMISVLRPMQTDATSHNVVACCWGFLANNVASVCMGLKVWSVSNYTQQVPTLLWFHANGRNMFGPNVACCWPTMLCPFVRAFKVVDGHRVLADHNCFKVLTSKALKNHRSFPPELNDSEIYRITESPLFWF